jgi:hypothetical protein
MVVRNSQAATISGGGNPELPPSRIEGLQPTKNQAKRKGKKLGRPKGTTLSNEHLLKTLGRTFNQEYRQDHGERDFDRAASKGVACSLIGKK